MTNNQKTILFDGRKAVRIDDLPDSAWTWFSGRGSEEQQKTRTLYIRVPWLSRAVVLRSNAVASLPFALVDADSGEDYDVSTDWENKVGFLPNPSKLLSLVESSLSLLGLAYLFNEHNRVKTLDLRYFAPTTITPDLDPITGLVGFKRNIGSQSFDLPPEDVIHFWQLDPFVELGPGNNSAATAALSAAGVLYNVDGFAEAFFDRGAIKVTLLTVKGPMPEAERDRLKSWWKRVFSGISNAWGSDIVQGDHIEPVVIGEGIKELSDNELTKEKREDIAAAMGIPMTILWSSEASGLGGGGVVQSDERKFYEQTIVPEALFIQSVFNEQLFEPMGLRWQFRPETLDVFQADENARSQSLVNYTNAGYRLSVASQILGVELPPGMDYDDLDEMRREDKEQAIANMQDSFGGGGPPGQGGKDVITCTSRSFRRRSAWQRAEPVLRNERHAIRFVIRLRLICSRPGTTFARCRSCSATRM